MSVYSRAEPKGLGDRPDTILRVLQFVKAHRAIAFLAYAPFRTTVHVIDRAKKAALGICQFKWNEALPTCRVTMKPPTLMTLSFRV